LAHKVETLLEEIKERVTPKESERAKLIGIAEELKKRVVKESEKMGVEVHPLLVGSLAKDTWLSGEGDIDLFMLFPSTLGRRQLEQVGLEVAEKVAGGKGVKAYAEHPYIRFYRDGVKIDLVPALKVENADAGVTAVDRTPFHLAYVNSKLNAPLRGEVRLLKRFMKGIKVYGSEAKTMGFSGYVCELLTINYGSFMNVLKSASAWNPPTLIAVDSSIRGDAGKHHLLVVDPTDKNRNAAAAVSLEAYATFIAASQSFLEKPSTNFFYPDAPKPPDSFRYGSDGKHLILIEFEVPFIVEETVWSELRSSSRGIKEHLERVGFSVRDVGFWTSQPHAYIYLEVDSLKLQETELRLGPKVYSRQDFERFVSKNCHRMVRGPWVKDDKWVMEVTRERRDILGFINDEHQMDLGPHIRSSYASKRVFVDKDAVEQINETPWLLREFVGFYLKKPPWLS
jgi:tRNA nucleotidyltransferase (CCA-adding enzyme)